MIITDKSKLITKCKPVSIFEAAPILSSLEKELAESGNGIGLSANQIGIDAAVCIIRYKDISINLVNPIIVEQFDKKLFRYDGCLSFPGKQISTARYNEIFVKDNMYPNGFVSVGIEAVIIEHEIDHLNGLTMFDREIVVPERNGHCWCGSGKKYKKCCLGKEIYFE